MLSIPDRTCYPEHLAACDVELGGAASNSMRSGHIYLLEKVQKPSLGCFLIAIITKLLP
jgi:hypothetical protein